MSYRYGLNGNDLRWEYMETVKYVCIDCAAAIQEARRTGETLDESFYDNLMCDGHTLQYTFGRGFGRLLHDTNGNFVRIVGNVPLDVFTTDYLAERGAADYDGQAWNKRALRELADESRISDDVGGWGNNNFGGETCLYVDDMRVVVRLQGGRVFAADVDTEYNDPDDGTEHEDSRQYVETSHDRRLYFDECIRFNYGGGRR
jgi:hypothetical protein